MLTNIPLSIFWLRRDLRLSDNAGLYYALKSNIAVLPIFIFDTTILDRLEDKSDARVKFIHNSLVGMQQELVALGSTLDVWYGRPEEVWKELIQIHKIANVYANHDYEPAARKRDRAIFDFLKLNNIQFHTFKDQCIFEYNEVLKDDSKPYTVFTPYSRKWKAKLNQYFLKSYPTEKYFANFLKSEPTEIISLEKLGFSESNITIPNKELRENIVKQYTEKRNFPSQESTTKLSVHLRFGTVSIRKLAQKATELNETWLNELIWRDFYMMILWQFPQVATSAFKPKYDLIQWRNNETEFKAWCEGKTGYPIVDAGMRELNATGFMHNRVRMVVASFLSKHLLIDWKWGEAYFAKNLIDFDLSANNGGWQWAAGSGVDAAPYFRIFNPDLQTEKFDKQHLYIKKWVPEFADVFNYPRPIVVHEFARKRCLEVYKQALGEAELPS